MNIKWIFFTVMLNYVKHLCHQKLKLVLIKFITLPTVIITDDTKNGKYFSGYNCEFIQDVNTKLYTGVIISLLNLKPKSTYPNVSIAILGGDVVD